MISARLLEMLHENHDQRTMTMDIRSASRPKKAKDTSQLYLYLNDVEARRTDVVKSVHTSSYLHILPTGKCDWGILTFAQQIRSVWFLSRNNLIEMYKWMPTKHKEKLFTCFLLVKYVSTTMYLWKYLWARCQQG